MKFNSLWRSCQLNTEKEEGGSNKLWCFDEMQRLANTEEQLKAKAEEQPPPPPPLQWELEDDDDAAEGTESEKHLAKLKQSMDREKTAHQLELEQRRSREQKLLAREQELLAEMRWNNEFFASLLNGQSSLMNSIGGERMMNPICEHVAQFVALEQHVRYLLCFLVSYLAIRN